MKTTGVLATILLMMNVAAGQTRKAMYSLAYVPSDITNQIPIIETEKQRLHQRELMEVEQRAEAWRTEAAKLAGPTRVVPGEHLRFVYAWPVKAFAKDDPSKIVNYDYLRANQLIYVSGDLRNTAEVKLLAGDLVILNRPQDGSAPTTDMLALLKFRSMKGVPKDIVENRLCPPAKVETGPDGKERWYYHHEFTDTRHGAISTNTRITGTIGFDGVDLNSVQTHPITLSRTVVLWDFTLVFDKDACVGLVEMGKSGPWEWKQSDP